MNLISELNEYQNSRNVVSSGTLSQWKELKEMLHETLKTISKQNINANSYNHESNKNHSWISIYADTLIKLKESHNNIWKELQTEEQELTKVIFTMNTELTKMIHSDCLNQQDSLLLTELEIHENDDIEISLFIEEWLMKISNLDLIHSNDLNNLQQEKVDGCAKLQINPNDRNGEWTETEHELFVKIYRRIQLEGLSRKIMNEILLSQLPKHLHEIHILHKHEEWYRLIKNYNLRKNDTIKLFETKRFELIKQAKNELINFRIEHSLKKQRDNELQESELNRTILHAKLDELRTIKALKDYENDIIKQQQENIELEKLNEINENIKNEQEMKRKQTELYKHEKLLLLQYNRKQEEIKLSEQKELIKQEIEKNKSKINERNQKIIEKEEERKRKQLELEAKETHRLELLMKLAEQVSQSFS